MAKASHTALQRVLGTRGTCRSCAVTLSTESVSQATRRVSTRGRVQTAPSASGAGTSDTRQSRGHVSACAPSGSAASAARRRWARRRRRQERRPRRPPCPLSVAFRLRGRRAALTSGLSGHQMRGRAAAVMSTRQMDRWRCSLPGGRIGVRFFKSITRHLQSRGRGRKRASNACDRETFRCHRERTPHHPPSNTRARAQHHNARGPGRGVHHVHTTVDGRIS